MSLINVNIKWGKITLKDVPLNTAEPPIAFKDKVLELTGVPVARQKLLIPKCPQLKDDPDWSKFPHLKDGVTIMLIGTAEVIDKSEVMEIEPNTVVAEQEVVRIPPGLFNLDNTCYFNSTIQVISSLNYVKQSLDSFAPGNSQDLDKLVSSAFKRTVTDLHSVNRTVIPIELVSVFRMAFPTFAQKGDDGHHMQQDAEECFSQVLLSLSKSLPPLPYDQLPKESNAISQLFAGQFEVTKKVLRLDGSVEESKSFENFLKLSCHIQNDTSFLQQALENSLNERIDGAGGDVTYIEKVSRIAALPYYLPVQYVRFFWKSDKNLRAKILKPVDVPLELDVYHICSDELKEKLRVKRDVEALPPVNPEEEVKKEGISENTTGKYELTAVISHKGRSADGGHYVAWVKDKGDDWFLFDDATVSVVKTKDIKQLSGNGGADWHIAYLCLYTTKN